MKRHARGLGRQEDGLCIGEQREVGWTQRQGSTTQSSEGQASHGEPVGLFEPGNSKIKSDLRIELAANMRKAGMGPVYSVAGKHWFPEESQTPCW